MFFGPGGLGGGGGAEGLDPALRKALLAQFPGLAQLTQVQAQPDAMQGYQWPGVQFFAGQGQGGFQNLSPFEGAKGPASESITAGLALGNYGKSSSQIPPGSATSPFSLGNLSLPSLALPQAVAAQQGGFSSGGENEAMVAGAGEPAGGGGMTFDTGDVLSAGEQIAGLFNSGTGPAFDPTGQTQQPAMQQQRAGERDLSTLGGSFLPPISAPGTFPNVQTAAPISSFLQPSGELQPGVTFEMQSPTMTAPGGSAQTALGTEAPSGDLLGGGLSTLQGLYNLYGGVQGGNVGQLLGGAGGALGGLSQMAPETAAALSQALGLSSNGLGLAAGGLGGLAGGFGLYQGLTQGDPLQAIMGAGSLYSGTAPIANAALGTSLPTITDILSAAGSGVTSTAPVIAGMTAAQSAAALGELGMNTAMTGASAAAGPATAILMAVQAITDYLSEQELKRSREAGWANNPIAGGLLSDATSGVQSATQALAAPGESTFDKGMALSSALNSLLPYYATAQGPSGPIRASDALTGMFGREGLGGEAEYTANFAKAQSGVVDMIKELLGRGVTYEQIGQLPVSEEWASGGDIDPTILDQYYARGADKYNAEAAQMISRLQQGATARPMTQWMSTGEGGMEMETGEVNYDYRGLPMSYATPENLFHAAQGANYLTPGAPKSITKAGGLVTGMYGGPVWTALARMGGAIDPQIQSMIQANFDPWADMRRMQPEQLAVSLSPIAQQLRFEATGVGGPIGPVGENAAPQTSAAPAPPPAENYWTQLGSQQRLASDPFTQALQRYQQQLGGLQGGLGQLTQGLQQPMTAGLDPGVVQALQQQQQPQSSGFAPGMNAGAGGGSIDLQALLRQMGLVA